MKSKSKNIALAGIWSALIFVVLLIETTLGMTVLPVFPPAILSFAVMLTLCLIGDWKYALTAGTILGLSSMVCAFIFGNVVFANPLVSVLPRIAMGMAGYFTYYLFRWIFRTRKKFFVREILPLSIGAALAIVTNTLLVMALSSAFSGENFLSALIGVVAAVNFPLELACSIVLTPFLVVALRRALKLDFGKKYGTDSNPPEKEPHDISH